MSLSCYFSVSSIFLFFYPKMNGFRFLKSATLAFSGSRFAKVAILWPYVEWQCQKGAHLGYFFHQNMATNRSNGPKLDHKCLDWNYQLISRYQIPNFEMILEKQVTNDDLKLKKLQALLAFFSV